MGMVFFALSLSLFIVTVAFIGLLISIKKSLVLEKVRQALRAQFRGDALEAYRKWALTEPSHGMQFGELGGSLLRLTNTYIVSDQTSFTLLSHLSHVITFPFKLI
eukprot:GHVN01014828.1.p1 GENE.GHVN01014828.1~~GHVN01014828.1.p1  ORF type:complete len:105 (-),score=13.28 GHVN01014828.1:360-674(-)